MSDRKEVPAALKAMYARRCANLELLIERFGSAHKLADALEVTQPNISQMRSPDHAAHRKFGEERARGMEEKLGLPVGWLDIDRRPGKAGHARMDDVAVLWDALPAKARDEWLRRGRALLVSHEG